MRLLLSNLSKKPMGKVILALVFSNFVSLLLYVARSIDAGNNRYLFLVWNLVLGWLPLLFAWWLKIRLQKTPWISIGNIVITLLWLGFLPNSFYIVSDLIHLYNTGEVSLLYDATMLFSYIFNSYVLGFMSLYIVHKQLIKRLSPRVVHLLIASILLLCSFAIYLGRYLRWNTWDVLINPAGLLFDVSDRIVNPIAHPQAFTTTSTFFLLLSSMYLVCWQLVAAISGNKHNI